MKIRTIKHSAKRAEMSLQVVAGAVIVLMIVVVLLYIFSKGTSSTANSFTSCTLKGGVCGGSCTGDSIEIPGQFSDCPSKTDTSKTTCCSKDFLATKPANP